jgi:hypothetical protein
MTQANYYLTSHPGSPEHRKAIYGQPKPREWLSEADKQIIQKIGNPKEFCWEKAKIKWLESGITYNGIKAAKNASGLTETTIHYHCRKPGGKFVVIGKQPPKTGHRSLYSVKDMETGIIYNNSAHVARETGIDRKIVYNNPRFVRVKNDPSL